MTVTLHLGDCVTWARQYSGDPFHALFCDAPYEMNFMNKAWDAHGTAFDSETWKALARPLYDGAFLFVFAGTINDDLISYAMRQAGLRKYHKMMGWVYGSGFPKASRLNHGHPMTEAFKGHRYGLQALKPAIETVLIFQKPYKGKPIDNITETGAGMLNIEGSRISAEQEYLEGYHNDEKKVQGQVYGWARSEKDIRRPPSSQGRWPANFYLDAEAARRLDEQSGVTTSGATKRNIPAYEGESITGFLRGASNPNNQHGDTGGASRFFFRVQEQIDEADPVRYVAKASRSERDAGLEGMPIQQRQGARPNSPDATGKFPEHDHRENSRNLHPTVKPISLARYLATLLLPPTEYAPRRLFVPFAGVASECIGAMQAGWEEIVGVEITEEYIPIARARVDYWSAKGIQRELL